MYPLTLTKPLALRIASFILCIVSLVSLIAVSNLLIFHIFLICKGVTTYQYIFSKTQINQVKPKDSLGATPQAMKLHEAIDSSSSL